MENKVKGKEMMQIIIGTVGIVVTVISTIVTVISIVQNAGKDKHQKSNRPTPKD